MYKSAGEPNARNVIPRCWPKIETVTHHLSHPLMQKDYRSNDWNLSGIEEKQSTTRGYTRKKPETIKKSRRRIQSRSQALRFSSFLSRLFSLNAFNSFFVNFFPLRSALRLFPSWLLAAASTSKNAFSCR